MPIAVIPKFKLQFFDRSIIKRNWGRINRGPLTRAGLLVRKIARSSIKRRKKGGKSGPAGQPPRSRQTGTSPPFKLIFSVVDPSSRFATVGMVGFGGANPTPALHEHGGTAKRTLFIPKSTQSRTEKGRFKRIRRRKVIRTVRYPKRPFMFPALTKATPMFPQFWRNSIR